MSVRDPAPVGSTRSGAPLALRLRDHLARNTWILPGDRVLVACSGGLDSIVLLHLFRFALRDLGATVEAAHFDHAMRAGSEEDALWVRGLTRAWDVPLHTARAEAAPRSEGEARALRYRFLDRVRTEVGAARVLTAHHADDQVETIVFRILRGTGLEGLRGIPETREPAILRPLLPFGRAELESYAREAGIRPREDPTNRSPRFARNRIRNELLPLLEELRPGVRDSILHLAEHADAGVRLLDRLVAPLVEEVVIERTAGRVILDRDRLLALGEIERSGVLRRVAGEFGAVLSHAATRVAEEFAAHGTSGGEAALTGRLSIGRSFDRIVLRRVRAGASEGAGVSATAGADIPLTIPGPAEGSGRVVCAGRSYPVRWGGEGAGSEAGAPGSPETGRDRACFEPATLRYPLRVRSWAPGDRTRTMGGGKKLKKLFGELRVPTEERHRVPLLVDADGVVLWIPGLHRVPQGGAGGRVGEESEGTSEAAKGPWYVEVAEGDHD